MRRALGPIAVAAALLVPSAAVAGDASAAKGVRHGAVVMGEPLTTRVITDAEQDGLAVGVVAVPETWRFQSQVVWNYAHHSSPVAISSAAENPANAEAVFGFPAAQYFDLRPSGDGFFQLGQSYGGYTYAHPLPPDRALVAFVEQVRAGATNLRWVGTKDLPDLPAALRLPPSPNQRGLGAKVTYDLVAAGGAAPRVAVEEEFYAVYYSVDVPYDGPQGRTWQTNWGLQVHSFRAPAGTLDRRRPVFAAIAKSFRPNPAWQERVAAINAYLAEQFNRQLQAGYDSIAAAGRLSRQISANNDAMLATIDRQLAASRRSSEASTSSAGAPTRGPNDAFDDYVRGVETLDDPYYGTAQRAATEEFHWTDGYGSYRDSNDATYDPNRTEVGNWQLMKPTR